MTSLSLRNGERSRPSDKVLPATYTLLYASLASLIYFAASLFIF